jgi:hypothetical protein
MLGAEFEIAREKMRAGFGPFTFILSLTGRGDRNYIAPWRWTKTLPLGPMRTQFTSARVNSGVQIG